MYVACYASSCAAVASVAAVAAAGGAAGAGAVVAGPGVVADRAGGARRWFGVVGAAGDGPGRGGRGGVVAAAWQHPAGDGDRVAANWPADGVAAEVVRASAGDRRGVRRAGRDRCCVFVRVVGGPVRRAAGPGPGGYRRAGDRAAGSGRGR